MEPAASLPFKQWPPSEREHHINIEKRDSLKQPLEQQEYLQRLLQQKPLEERLEQEQQGQEPIDTTTIAFAPADAAAPTQQDEENLQLQLTEPNLPAANNEQLDTSDPTAATVDLEGATATHSNVM